QRLFEELDRRLNASFNGMNERLELITKGFGEISEFGRGVDEIKKALGNVKVRGIVGEIQLGILLEQMLAPTQYIKNAQTLKNSQARVDFAIRLPGKDERDILLPIDAKFPLEDYVRLTEAINQNNQAAIKDAEARIEIQIVKQAKEITKYINPPETTDFAIMYIPTEGLFAEILRRPGLTERVHREFKVSITGPSTIAAFLSSLKMGFQTLYVEKRSSEIFKHLAEFNKDFNTFVTTLEKAEKKIGEASGHIGEATNRTRIIQKRLSKLGHGSSDLLETKDPDDYEEQ
ncbi:MAG: DNA recombination protein RmuC, partial [Firmicutes bacterium]|nr:DNA recombination protein RmuC [Bacillota bacterium]